MINSGPYAYNKCPDLLSQITTILSILFYGRLPLHYCYIHSIDIDMLF